MDRRQVLIGTGAVAVASTTGWTPEVSARPGMKPRPQNMSSEVFSPFEDGLRGSYTLRAISIDMNGSLVPL